jgi:hypothetical protein
MKTIIGQEILKRESQFQMRQNLRGEVSNQYCDRGDTLFSSSGVCFESGIRHDVTHRDGSEIYRCDSGSCFECGL